MNYSLEFEFNNVHSSYYDVFKVSLQSGLQEELYFLANKTVNGFKTKNDYNFHKTSVSKEPLVIPLVLWLNGNIDEEREQDIKRWLETDDFCKLQFDESSFYFNAMLNGQPKFSHNAIGDGYVEFEFITDSPYRFSEPKPLSGQCIDTVTFPLTNYGDLIAYPVIEIVAPNTTNGVEIINSTTKQHFTLNGVFTDLTMTIYNQYEELDSEGNFDLYNNSNLIFISLVRGVNEIQMKGQFYYKITYTNVHL